MEADIKKMVIKAFSFLEDEGFKRYSHLNLSSVNKNKIIETLHYDKGDIRIELTLFSSEKWTSLFLAIDKLSLDTCFLFDDYLLYNKKDKEEDRFENESVEDYIKRFSQFFKKEINGDLRDVIAGKTWIEVPEDWGPYK